MSDAIAITSITTAGGLASLYLANKYKHRILKKEEKPKDRVDFIFDGYEGVIRNQREEIKRKDDLIDRLYTANRGIQESLQKAQEANEDTRTLLDMTRKELDQVKFQNEQLTEQLSSFRKDYTLHKNDP